MHGSAPWKTEETIVGLPSLLRFGGCHEWHSVKPNTLGLKVLRTKTPARRPMINNMISISLDGKPCVSESYSILFMYNTVHLILVRVERKSLIRKTLMLIRVPFTTDSDSVTQLVEYQRNIGVLPRGASFSVRTSWAKPLSALGGSLRTYLADYKGVTTHIGTERARLTHPERAKLTHPRFENGRSGQERQLGFHSDFRLFLDFIDSRKR